MKTSTLPQFQGRPIIPQDMLLPRAEFLTGDFGQAVLEEFEGRVKADYAANKSLGVLSYDEDKNVVLGSNPFAVMLINDIVAQARLNVATQADLEAILKCNTLPLRDAYEEGALVLRPEDKSYVAQHLARQIQSRQKIDGPVMVYLREFTAPQTDAQSPYRLVCQLKEDARLIPAPQLADKNNGRKFSQTDEHGLPIFDKQGSRTSYTSSDLSRVYLWDLDLISNLVVVDLGNSKYKIKILYESSNGRIAQLGQFSR